MLRCEVSEVGQAALPAVDVDDACIVIGSAPTATIRIPGPVAEHVRIEGTAWTALADVTVDGAAYASGATGAIGAGVTFELGSYRVRITQAPVGSLASAPQRTESLARELVRSLLGSGGAPTLEVTRGPVVGAKRMLPPPDATLVIGRGDEATWVILDGDLSRTHAEVRRGWDGVSIRDLGSKNGTLVGGVKIAASTPIADGATIALGKVELVFRDPAERHLRGEVTLAARPAAVRARAPEPVVTPRPAKPWAFLAAAAIASLALVGLVWILAS